MGPLNHSPADILRYALIALGVGSHPLDDMEWPIHATLEPNVPDDCITVYDTAGEKDGRLQLTNLVVDKPGIQVRIRSSHQHTGYVKANEVKLALDDLVRTAVTMQEGTGTGTSSLNEYLIHLVSRRGDIIPLGKETPTSKRSHFTINGLISVETLPEG